MEKIISMMLASMTVKEMVEALQSDPSLKAAVKEAVGYDEAK